MLSLFGDSLGNLQSLKEVTFYHGKDSVIKVLREKLSELGFEQIEINSTTTHYKREEKIGIFTLFLKHLCR